jgi:hypothetical protein
MNASCSFALIANCSVQAQETARLGIVITDWTKAESQAIQGLENSCGIFSVRDLLASDDCLQNVPVADDEDRVVVNLDAFLTTILKLLRRLPIYPMFGRGRTRVQPAYGKMLRKRLAGPCSERRHLQQSSSSAARASILTSNFSEPLRIKLASRLG